LTAVLLISLSLLFLWTAFRSAAVDPADWNVTLLGLAVLALSTSLRKRTPPLPPAIAWPLLLLPAWCLFQLAPLPAAVVNWISPSRGALASALHGLAPASSFLPLSVAPSATLIDWLRVAGAVLVFLIVRELAWRCSDNDAPWIVVLPLLSVACLEAALGLIQSYTGASGSMGAHGTYASRDHFAGLLEMALPFPVMCGIAALWRGRRRFSSPLRPALIACLSFAAGALLLLGAIHSLSRMGFIASLFALGVLGASAVRRKIWLLAVPFAGLLLFLFLPPGVLIMRFADLASADQIAAQDRVEVWRETIPLIRAYSITGCGLGAYESAFMPFKRKTPMLTDSYAHNDYLQYLAELGLPGFVLLAWLLAAIVLQTVRAASLHAAPPGRALALACLASMLALFLHSLVDFNSYVPANIFAFAWVAALGCSGIFAPKLSGGAAGLVIDVSPGQLKGSSFWSSDIQDTLGMRLPGAAGHDGDANFPGTAPRHG
jgi:O-antigen ligase